MKNGSYIMALWIFLLIAVMAFRGMEDKKYKVEYTQQEWQVRYSWIEIAKQQLKKSDLPSKDVVFVCDSLLGKWQNELAAQLQPQFAVDTTTKKKTK